MEAVYLHGCVGQGCDTVWRDTDAANVCDKCGTQRFDVSGKAREFVIWHPLASRFESLLKCEQYCESVKHECRRPQATDTDYITKKGKIIFNFSVFILKLPQTTSNPGNVFESGV